MKKCYKLTAVAAAIVIGAPVWAQTTDTATGNMSVTVPAAVKSTCGVAVAGGSLPSLTLNRDSTSGAYSWAATGGSATLSVTQGDLPAKEKIDVAIVLNRATVATALNNHISGAGTAAAIADAQLTLNAATLTGWTLNSATAGTNTYSLGTLTGIGATTTIPFGVNTATLPVTGLKMKNYDAQSVTVNGAYTITCTVASNAAAV